METKKDKKKNVRDKIGLYIKINTIQLNYESRYDSGEKWIQNSFNYGNGNLFLNQFKLYRIEQNHRSE